MGLKSQKKIELTPVDFVTGVKNLFASYLMHFQDPKDLKKYEPANDLLFRFQKILKENESFQRKESQERDLSIVLSKLEEFYEIRDDLEKRSQKLLEAELQEVISLATKLLQIQFTDADFENLLKKEGELIDDRKGPVDLAKSRLGFVLKDKPIWGASYVSLFNKKKSWEAILESVSNNRSLRTISNPFLFNYGVARILFNVPDGDLDDKLQSFLKELQDRGYLKL